MKRTQESTLKITLNCVFALQLNRMYSTINVFFPFAITPFKQNTQCKQIIGLPQSPAVDHRRYFADVLWFPRALCFVPTAFYQVLLPVANLSELKAHKLIKMSSVLLSVILSWSVVNAEFVNDVGALSQFVWLRFNFVKSIVYIYQARKIDML